MNTPIPHTAAPVVAAPHTAAPASVTLRPLERGDLNFVHQRNNNRSIMGYWFEEPYESYVEPEELYRKHIHDQSGRRFIIEDRHRERTWLVELVEIDHLHRRGWRGGRVRRFPDPAGPE